VAAQHAKLKPAHPVTATCAVSPLEGFKTHEWVCFERALVVRDLFTGGVRTFFSTADAQHFRTRLYQHYGAPGCMSGTSRALWCNCAIGFLVHLAKLPISNAQVDAYRCNCLLNGLQGNQHHPAMAKYRPLPAYFQHCMSTSDFMQPLPA